MNIDVLRQTERDFRASSGFKDDIKDMTDQTPEQKAATVEVYSSLRRLISGSYDIRRAAKTLIEASSTLKPAWERSQLDPIYRQPSESPLINIYDTERGASLTIGVRRMGKLSGVYDVMDYSFEAYLSNPLPPAMIWDSVVSSFVGYGIDGLPHFGRKISEGEGTQDIIENLKSVDVRKISQESGQPGLEQAIDLAVTSGELATSSLFGTLNTMRTAMRERSSENSADSLTGQAINKALLQNSGLA